ncbi:DUF4972 domain-containing protein [Sinomicrobium sp. 2019215]|nr:DUF4972 domain-containing protein [Sinomicrobium weinanense]
MFFCLLLIYYSCSEDDKIEKREVNLDCLYQKLDIMTSTLDTAAIGEEDGMYPQENADALLQSVDELELGISQGLAGHFTLQYEADNYCNTANKAIAEFRNSLQLTLPPGTPAELIVYGIDQKGRIEFGSNPVFGGDDAFTVEAWLKYDENFFESGIGDFIATFDNSGQPQEGWMINFLGDNLRATLGMGPQESRVLEFGNPYPKTYGQWNHIAMVYDQSLSEGQLRMYVNGELFFSKTNDIYNDGGELQLYQPNTRNYNMWAFQEPTDQSRCMTGHIKKFRFWNSAMSVQQINSLMHSDVSGNEADLECAWDFTMVPEDDENITDKTGKHIAKIVGEYKWKPIEN